MSKRLALSTFAVLLVTAALTTPKPAAGSNCWVSFQYCDNNCGPDDQQCHISCECAFYSCIGAELPNQCI